MKRTNSCTAAIVAMLSLTTASAAEAARPSATSLSGDAALTAAALPHYFTTDGGPLPNPCTATVFNAYPNNTGLRFFVNLINPAAGTDNNYLPLWGVDLAKDLSGPVAAALAMISDFGCHQLTPHCTTIHVTAFEAAIPPTPVVLTCD